MLILYRLSLSPIQPPIGALGLKIRNILIHGYDLVDDAEVWKVICEHLPVLAKQVEALLRQIENR